MINFEKYFCTNVKELHIDLGARIVVECESLQNLGGKILFVDLLSPV